MPRISIAIPTRWKSLSLGCGASWADRSSKPCAGWAIACANRNHAEIAASTLDPGLRPVDARAAVPAAPDDHRAGAPGAGGASLPRLADLVLRCGPHGDGADRIPPGLSPVL